MHGWLKETWWRHIDAHIDIITDFRYLGAHITMRADCRSATMNKRLDTALQQLGRLRHVPATVQAKVHAILAKVYATAFYGIEAAYVAPGQIAKLTSAVIDVFKRRNNDYNVDLFFTTLTEEEQELDPMVQQLLRRVMQMRRTDVKKKGAEASMKRVIRKYAEKISTEIAGPSGITQGKGEMERSRANTLKHSRIPPRRTTTKTGIAKSTPWGP